MVSRAQKVRLAVFLIVGFSILFTILILLLGSKITEKRDFYQIVFEDTSVARLQIGSAVLYRGIRIGRVETIQIDRNRITDVVVSISILHETPIKADQEATLVTAGITGIKQIELRGGTNESPFLQPGDTIPTGRTLFDNLTDRAEALAYRVEQILDNLVEITNRPNQDKLSSILGNMDSIVSEAQGSMIDTVSNISDITAELSIAMVVITDILVKIDHIFDEDKIYNIISNTETITTSMAEIDFSQVNTIVESMNGSIQRASQLISRIDTLVQRNSPDLNSIIEELRETLENLSEFSRIISDDPSILIRSRRQN